MNNQIYQQRFQKLNEQQKKAVETTEGPVMVIAGPGTGKTEILAARITNILQKPQSEASAHNILCLTYTNAGVVAMRKRLLEFVGPDAYKVQIHTYHSFCNEVIQQNLEYFGKRELELISDLEIVQFLEKIVDSFDPKHPLFHSSGYFEVTRLKTLFNTMKAENWSPEDIEKATGEYLDDLPKREEFCYKRTNATKGIKAGDVKEKAILSEKKKMEVLCAAAREFVKYEEMLKETGRYDYQDMILWVLKAFKSNEALLAPYQEQFLYVLVDEYQDTNGSQNEILQLLISYWEEPNICIVGDDDQSIFRFQGANLRNIMSFYSQYEKSTEKVVLLQNYRSSQKVLDVSMSLIERNTERLVREIPGLTKELKAQNSEYSDSPTQPQVLEYFNTAHEEAGVVAEIERLQKQGVNLSEIAIVYNKHRQAANIIKLLEQKQIPLNVKESINILETPFFQNIFTLYTYLSCEHEKPGSGEYLLFHLLHSDFFTLPAKDIALLYLKFKECQKKKNIEPPISTLRELITSPETIHTLFSLEKKQQILELGEHLEKWIHDLHNTTLQQFFEMVLTESGILKYVMDSDDRAWRMRILSTLFRFLKEENVKHPNMDLKHFLKTFEQMQKHGIYLPVNKIQYSKAGVHLLTAHSSKGLEFTHVFLIGCESRVWDKNTRKINEYSFPDTLTLTQAGSDLEETRRLFYVALTRAKEHLHISYAAQDMNGKALEPSQFVAEILQHSKDTVFFEKRKIKDNAIIEHEYLLIKKTPELKKEIVDTEFINELLKDYRLNITHLNKYLRCPLSFYYENILRVPSAMNQYTSFGSAMHYALEHFFRTGKERKRFGETESLQQYFIQNMERNKPSFTEEQFTRRLEYGKQTLEGYYDQYHEQWNTNILVEYFVNQCSCDDVPIVGKLDKIEFEENNICVVDYKTGKYANARKKLHRPNEKDPLGGDYWRQIVFYKLLIDNEGRQRWNMVSGEMDFLEKDAVSGEFKKEKIVVTTEDEVFVKNQVKEVYAKIMNHEFSQGCEEEFCAWCRKNNQNTC